MKNILRTVRSFPDNIDTNLFVLLLILQKLRTPVLAVRKALIPSNRASEHNLSTFCAKRKHVFSLI